ncbi:hypothetical protein L208DRAFT_1378056 [Tricholoma matsutake]|nr:hypothetical protein L208DRAFT_1378056 [Tricholoma matsutake 945]
MSLSDVPYNNATFGNFDWTWSNGGQMQLNIPSDSWFKGLLSTLPSDGQQSADLGLEVQQPSFTTAHAGPLGAGVSTLLDFTVSTQNGLSITDLSHSFLSPLSLFSSIQNLPLVQPPSFQPGLELGTETQGFQVPGANSHLCLPPSTTIPILPPPSVGGIILHAVAPLSSNIPSSAMGLLLMMLSEATQLSPGLPNDLQDGKENKAVGDKNRGSGQVPSGHVKGPGRKRKADDLSGTKNGDKPTKARKKHVKPGIKPLIEMGNKAANGVKETDRVVTEAAAKVAQEAVIEAAKAAKEAAKATKEAAKATKEAAKATKEAAKEAWEAVGEATKSGRTSNMPSHLKQAGYMPPKQGSQKKVMAMLWGSDYVEYIAKLLHGYLTYLEVKKPKWDLLHYVTNRAYINYNQPIWERNNLKFSNPRVGL